MEDSTMSAAATPTQTAVDGAANDKKAPRIGFYDVDKTIGKGNFAVVKLAQHRITKSKVAIKIIDKSNMDDAGLKKVYREISILKLLHHPNVVSLYQVMESEKMLYIVTEYVANGEVYDYIMKNGRFNERQACHLFAQVVKAVRFCHDNHIVHRDLKAENLLIDQNMNLKLADFGFGSFYQSTQQLATWCGSPPYAAPEMFLGKPYDPHAVDIWSLGVILYVLVCGTLPFDAPTLPALKKRVLSCRFRIPFFMSTDCESIIRRMLLREPSKRLRLSEIETQKWMGLNGGDASTSLVAQDTTPDKQRYHEQTLRLMKSLGISVPKALESIRLDTYDNYMAIYLLLCERCKQQASQGSKQPARPSSELESAGTASPVAAASAELTPTLGQTPETIDSSDPSDIAPDQPASDCGPGTQPASQETENESEAAEGRVADVTPLVSDVRPAPSSVSNVTPVVLPTPESSPNAPRCSDDPEVADELQHRHSVDEGIMIDDADRVSRSLHPSKSFASSSADKPEDCVEASSHSSAVASSHLCGSDASECSHDACDLSSPREVAPTPPDDTVPPRNDASTDNFDSDERTVTDNSERASTPKLPTQNSIESPDYSADPQPPLQSSDDVTSGAACETPQPDVSLCTEQAAPQDDAPDACNDQALLSQSVKDNRHFNLTPLRINTQEVLTERTVADEITPTLLSPADRHSTPHQLAPRRQHIGLPLLPSKGVVTSPKTPQTELTDGYLEGALSPRYSGALSPPSPADCTDRKNFKSPFATSPLRVDELSRSAPRFMARSEQKHTTSDVQRGNGATVPRICTPVRR